MTDGVSSEPTPAGTSVAAAEPAAHAGAPSPALASMVPHDKRDKAASNPAPDGPALNPTLGGTPAGGASVTNQTNADKFQGANVVNGSLHFHGTDSVMSWEDELNAIRGIPEPGQAVPQDDVLLQADALHEKRLLLISHASHLQEQASSAMRAVLLQLQKRHPNRAVFASSMTGALHLKSLRRAGEWRQDRRGALIYLYRSADPASQSFFDSIEDVLGLQEQLTRMDAHLAITIKLPATAFRDQAQLTERIALWTLDEPRPAAAGPRPAPAFSGPFELTVALCAALLPGLGVAEFASLVDALAHKPESLTRTPSAAGPAAPTAPVRSFRQAAQARNRHERWWLGERDVVLAELGVQLRTPLASDGAEADSAEPGMMFEASDRRAEMPAWLYDHQPIFLAQKLDVLTRHYLTASASSRFRAGYRRFVMRMDAIGAHRLTADWLLAHFRTELEAATFFTEPRGLAELLAEADTLRREPLRDKFIDGVAESIVAQEAELIRWLGDNGWLRQEIEAQNSPHGFLFWVELGKRFPAAGVAVGQAAARQAICMGLLQTLTARDPQAIARTLGNALGACDQLHAPWVRDADLDRDDDALFSLARVVFIEMQQWLLDRSALQWLEVAQAIADAYRPASAARVRTPSPGQPQTTPHERALKAVAGRRLACYCFYTLAGQVEKWLAVRASPPSHAHALLFGAEVSPRFGTLLAELFRLAAPPAWRDDPAPADAEQVIAGSAESIELVDMLRLFRALALMAMARGDATPEGTTAEMARLVGPLRSGLRPELRMVLTDATRGLVDLLFGERETLVGGFDRGEQAREERRELTRQIQAMQTVQRALRGTAGRPALDPPLRPKERLS